MMSARKVRWPMSDQLARDAAAALAAGLTYGKYMAIKENRDPLYDDPLPGERKLICEKCGNPFFRSDRKLVKFCRECREGRTVRKKTCPVCGKEFVCKNAKRLYCDDHCKELANGRAARERYQKKNAEAGPKTHICAECGKPFEAENRGIYCGDDCRRKAHNRNIQRYRQKRRAVQREEDKRC